MIYTTAYAIATALTLSNGFVIATSGTYVENVSAELYDYQAQGRVRFYASTGGTNSGSIPSSPSYVVLAPSSALSNARTLAEGENVTITDGGPGQSVTISATGGNITASYITADPESDLSDSYLLAAGSHVAVSSSSFARRVTIAAAHVAPDDPSYLLFDSFGATSELPNARRANAGPNIVLDSTLPGQLTISGTINDSIVATVSGTRFTGRVDASAGLTGSLQLLSNGKSYLVGGNLITVTSGSGANGQVRIDAVSDSSKADKLTTLTAGNGLTGGGDLSTNRSFDVGANADGSIKVNADDIQVGVLASDAQHGNRGGGAIHPAVTTSVNGFMSAADKVKLDGLSSGAPLTTAAPNTIGTTNSVGTSLSASHADHTHAHGAQTDGTLHAVATTSVAGFLSTSDKANLDSVVANYAPRSPSYVTLATDFTLTAERVLTGSGIAIQDNGAGSTVVLSPAPQSLAVKTLSLSGWTQNPSDIVFAYSGLFVQQTQVATGAGSGDNIWYIDVQSQLPERSTLVTAITLYVQGATGHSALPGTMPSFLLNRYDPTSGGAVNVVPQTTDTSANTTAYQAAHSISWTGSKPIDPTQRHVLIVNGEQGGTAVAGMKLLGLSMTVAFT